MNNFKKYQIYNVLVTEFQCVHNGKFIVIVSNDMYEFDNVIGDTMDFQYDYLYKILLNENVLSKEEILRSDLVLSEETYGFCTDSVFSESLFFITDTKRG